MKRREEMNLIERLYIPAVLQGLCVTFGRMLRNLSLHLLHAVGLAKPVPASVVIEYPDARRPYAENYRGRHRLTLKDDGSVKCTSCYMCATACPARCIYIKPAEHQDARVEKYPDRFEIDTLLCIYCGYCVEACPVDAIRMDTGLHPEVYAPDPRLFIEDKETLMERSRQIQDKSVKDLYRAHQDRMIEMEKHPLKKAVAVLLMLTALAQPLSADEAQTIEVPALPQGVPALPDPEATPRLINAANADQYQKIILPELFPLVKSGELPIDAVRELRYSWRYDDEWERNSRQETLKFEQNSTSPTVSDFRRGFAAGDYSLINQESDRSLQARRILWNISSLWWSQKALLLNFNLFTPSSKENDFFFTGTLSRLYPRTLDQADQSIQIFRELLKFSSPAWLSQLAFLGIRFHGDEEDGLWLRSAATEKSRELTGLNRTDPLLKSSFSLDDLLVWSGKPELLNPMVDKELVALIPFPSTATAAFSPSATSCEALQPGAVKWNYLSRKYPDAAPWLPANAIYVPRALYRLTLTSTNPFSLYGRQVLYVDMKSMLPLVKVVFDRAGRHWKTIIGSYELGVLSDKARRVPAPAFIISKDLLNGQTWVVDFRQVTRCESLSEQLKLSDFTPAALGVTAPRAQEPVSSSETPGEEPAD